MSACVQKTLSIHVISVPFPRAFEMSIISAHVLSLSAHHIHSHIDSFTSQCTNPAETKTRICCTHVAGMQVEAKSKTKLNILEISICCVGSRPSQYVRNPESQSQSGSRTQCKLFHQHLPSTASYIPESKALQMHVLVPVLPLLQNAISKEICVVACGMHQCGAEVGKERTCWLGHVAHGQEESDMRTVECLNVIVNEFCIFETVARAIRFIRSIVSIVYFNPVPTTSCVRFHTTPRQA
jgi:hypothetical protein